MSLIKSTGTNLKSLNQNESQNLSKKSKADFLTFRLEFMVARVKNDMDKIEFQLSEAESTISTDLSANSATFKSIMPNFILVSCSILALALNTLKMMTEFSNYQVSYYKARIKGVRLTQ